MSGATKVIHVAVGVIINAEQQILIALRPEESHQGGLWEFPGGKVESGETVQQALFRELKEELGIKTSAYKPLMNIHHDYGDKRVLLDVWWVKSFTGEAVGQEGQDIKWVDIGKLQAYQFPVANKTIVEAIQGAQHSVT
jgi:8-oxo-dGTP diphosphatase